MFRSAIVWTAGLGLAALSGCGDPSPASSSSGSSSALTANTLDSELCSPRRIGFTLDSLNPYFPLEVGSQSILEGEDEGVPVRLQVSVLDETERVAGVLTRVLEEREWEGDELKEVSRNFFAVAVDGTVCYFGEDVDIFAEDGSISHEGAWRAGESGNQPGIIMPADPRPGMKFQAENAPGVAEDELKVVGIGPVEVPAGEFDDAIRLREYNPLDGDKGYKIFAPDVGLVVDEALELSSY